MVTKQSFTVLKKLQCSLLEEVLSEYYVNSLLKQQWIYCNNSRIY